MLIVSRMSGLHDVSFLSSRSRAAGFAACRCGRVAAAPYPLVGREAPDFALHALVGSNVRLSEHLGDVVVVSFWGSRCGPCGTQLDALNRSLSTYAVGRACTCSA